MSYNGGRVVELNNQHNGLRGDIDLDNNGHFVGIAKLLMLGLISLLWKKIPICSISFVLMKILN